MFGWLVLLVGSLIVLLYYVCFGVLHGCCLFDVYFDCGCFTVLVVCLLLWLVLFWFLLGCIYLNLYWCSLLWFSVKCLEFCFV